MGCPVPSRSCRTRVAPPRGCRRKSGAPLCPGSTFRRRTASVCGPPSASKSGSERSSRISVLRRGARASAPYTAPSAYYFPSAGRMNGTRCSRAPARLHTAPIRWRGHQPDQTIWPTCRAAWTAGLGHSARAGCTFMWAMARPHRVDGRSASGGQPRIQGARWRRTHRF